MRFIKDIIAIFSVFFRKEVAPECRPPLVRSSIIKPENFILKAAIAYHISSNISREITAEKTYKPKTYIEENGKLWRLLR